jgi:hypothetical protein
MLIRAIPAALRTLYWLETSEGNKPRQQSHDADFLQHELPLDIGMSQVFQGLSLSCSVKNSDVGSRPEWKQQQENLRSQIYRKNRLSKSGCVGVLQYNAVFITGKMKAANVAARSAGRRLNF